MSHVEQHSLRISLVIATLGRSTELHELFESIHLQNYSDVECVVVDQNDDDRLLPVLDRWCSRLEIHHLRCEPGLSKARNLGLQRISGDLVAFPDDDCWYPAGLLQSIANWFQGETEYSILSVGARDRDGQLSGNRWIQSECDLHARNVFRTTFSSTLFLRCCSAVRKNLFDPSIGVGAGTPFSSGEETDYILQLLSAGLRGRFNRGWHIGHPKRDMLSGTIDIRRAAGYGRGMGYVLRKHRLLSLCAAFFFYDLLRAAVVLPRGDREAARLCWHHGFGIVSGYLVKSRKEPATGDLSNRSLKPFLHSQDDAS